MKLKILYIQENSKIEEAKSEVKRVKAGIHGRFPCVKVIYICHIS